MANRIPTQPAKHSIAAEAANAHLTELLRALPELTRAHIAAAAKFEACMQLLALGMTTAPASVPTASLDPEAFPASNPILLADQSARAAVPRRLAATLDAKPNDITPPARQRSARILPTREERLRRLEEKHQRELAECRARSAERHREQHRQSIMRRKRAARGGLTTGFDD